MNWPPAFINRRKLQQLQMILPLDKTRYLRKSRIVAQERVRFREGVYFGTHDVHLGAYSGMRSGHLAMVSSIGRYCSIAGEAMIGQDPLDHPTHWLSTHYFQFGEHVDNGISYQSDWQDARIGNDVWIGRGALIMKGLTIGDGAIVGARSVVTKDVPPYAIVVGAPAKIIKYRFPEDICARLLELQWWRWSPAQLADVPFDKIEAAMDRLQDKVEQKLAPYQPRELTLHRVRGGLKVEILQ